MPYYEYTCRECGEDFSKKRSFAEASQPADCPVCGGVNTQKRFSAVAVIGGTSRGDSGRESIPLQMSGGGGGCGCGGGGCGCHSHN